MYKHARGGYRDISPIRQKKPLPRRYWRSFYYSAIAQDTRTGKDFCSHHQSAPTWLKEEVKSFGQKGWLAYWNKKTGQPNQAVTTRKRAKAKRAR